MLILEDKAIIQLIC